MKKRIDHLLVEKGLVETRQRGQALIMAGQVYIEEQKILKAGEKVAEESNIIIKGKDHPYVSRGGLKLEKAIEFWKLDFNDKVVLDIGSSTGGFTDCALQNGAKRVYAVDVGTNQLDYSLRINPQVVVHEKTNFRTLSVDFFPEKMQIIVIDVSFISLKLIIKNAIAMAAQDFTIVALIKPQFEVGKKIADEYRGVITSDEIHNNLLQEMRIFFKECGLSVKGIIPSPIYGQKGNKEYLCLLTSRKEAI